MSISAVTQEDAIALARQLSTNGVRLVATDYNWGPPVSGRFDTDYLNMWAVVSGEPEGTLHLQGESVNGGWDVDREFERGEVIQGNNGNTMTFFALGAGDPYRFPKQFVLRFDGADGSKTYDNNGGANYRLTPYGGRGASAVSTGQAIFVFNGINQYHLQAH